MIDKDKVVQLAKEAGLANQFPTAPMLDMFERFAQAIYRQGLEDAAKVMEGRLNYPDEKAGVDMDIHDGIDAIRSLKESTNG